MLWLRVQFSKLGTMLLFFAVNGVVFDKGAAEIECGSRFTAITLGRAKFPWFNSERMRMHLNDPSCRPSYVTTVHVSFKMPLGGCGSRHITSPRKVIFTNRVFIVEKGYHSYKEKEMKTLMEIHFLCKYRRIGLLSESVNQNKRLLWEMKILRSGLLYTGQEVRGEEGKGGDEWGNLCSPSPLPSPPTLLLTRRLATTLLVYF